MRQNGYAKVDVRQLAFDRIKRNSMEIIIPIIGSLDYVVCQNQEGGQCWRSVKMHSRWYDCPIERKLCAEIYKLLEGYIA